MSLKLFIKNPNSFLSVRLIKKFSTNDVLENSIGQGGESSKSSQSKPWYRFPLGLFVVFESLSPVIWTTDLDNKFDYFIATPCELNKSLIMYLKKHVFSNLSYVTDITYMGVSPWVPAVSLLKGSNKPVAIGMWSLYLFHSRVRLHLMSTIGGKTLQPSVDSIYKNTNWLERESCEMYGINTSQKGDARRLLLNYFDLNAPLRKNYNSSSNYEVYYDFTDRQVQYVTGARSEL